MPTHVGPKTVESILSDVVTRTPVISKVYAYVAENNRAVTLHVMSDSGQKDTVVWWLLKRAREVIELRHTIECENGEEEILFFVSTPSSRVPTGAQLVYQRPMMSFG